MVLLKEDLNKEWFVYEIEFYKKHIESRKEWIQEEGKKWEDKNECQIKEYQTAINYSQIIVDRLTEVYEAYFDEKY